MSNEKVRQLLVELNKELRTTDLDTETRQQLNALDDDIHALIDPAQPSPANGRILDAATELQSRFSVNHPQAEKLIRSVVETLNRMGF